MFLQKLKIIGLVLCTVLFTWSCKESSGNKTSEEKKEIDPFEKVNAKSAIKFEADKISTEGTAEFGITFTKDMQSLFFTSKREGDKNFTIYTSNYVDGKWETPIAAPFSGNYFDADAFIGPEGKKLFFFSMRPFPGDTTTLDKPNIWYVESKDVDWTEPKLLEGAVNTNTSGEGYLSLTNENTMYFSSVGRMEGKKHDIFKSNHSQRRYLEPEYVEIAIETTFSNPYISPSEDYLIIDSEQPGGLGGSDLYFVKRTGPNTWEEPKNMGPLINTEGDEGTPSLSPDGKWFFFSRDGDIYYIESDQLPIKLK